MILQNDCDNIWLPAWSGRGKSLAEKIFLLLPQIHPHFQPNPCLPALRHKAAAINCQTDCKTEINTVLMWSSHIPVKIHSVPECVNTLSWFAWPETRIHIDESLSLYLTHTHLCDPETDHHQGQALVNIDVTYLYVLGFFFAVLPTFLFLNSQVHGVRQTLVHQAQGGARCNTIVWLEMVWCAFGSLTTHVHPPLLHNDVWFWVAYMGSCQ